MQDIDYFLMANDKNKKGFQKIINKMKNKADQGLIYGSILVMQKLELSMQSFLK